MLRIVAILTVLTATLVAPNFVQAEPLYPEGHNLLCLYDINPHDTYADDTITITRTVINNQSYYLVGLYFSENIPNEFQLVDYAITRNGESITAILDTGSQSLFTGYNCYYWIIDDPNGSVQRIINPEDSLVLSVRLTCATSGDYTLPMHTSTFFGNSIGFFATDDSIQISILPATDTTPPSDILDLEAN